MNRNRVQNPLVERQISLHMEKSAAPYFLTCKKCSRTSGHLQAMTLNSHLKEEAKVGRSNESLIEDPAIMSHYDSRYWDTPYFNLFVKCRTCQGDQMVTLESHKLMTQAEFQGFIEQSQTGYINRIHYGSPTTLFVNM